ncbi:hypothetical protein BpHYR1_012766 [Brachionus plicatilis]|uniref:Uncharacterized protein n=1 Tax=Brachionus plicatilis TaxID=10195 RepID=A0A3M7STY8_BRAPC|nr:hypothetical protein BpHYR1_012766 [Brachionus plicatilis]
MGFAVYLIDYFYDCKLASVTIKKNLFNDIYDNRLIVLLHSEDIQNKNFNNKKPTVRSFKALYLRRANFPLNVKGCFTVQINQNLISMFFNR